MHIDLVRPAVGGIRPDLREPHVHTMDRVVHPGANTVYDVLESGKRTGVQLCRSLLAVIGRIKQIAGVQTAVTRNEFQFTCFRRNIVEH